MTGRLFMLLAVALVLMASPRNSRAQGVLTIEDATVDIQVVQGSGRVGACGVRIKAPYRIGVDTVRTWEVTLYVPDWHIASGIAVDAASYDTSKSKAEPQMRPAPVELSFSVKGNPQIFTATDIHPSERAGESLAMLRDKTAGQIMTAFYTKTPVVVFFRPQNSDTEVVIASGSMKPEAINDWGQCLQAMQRH
jgi:hypothetical protein